MIHYGSSWLSSKNYRILHEAFKETIYYFILEYFKKNLISTLLTKRVFPKHRLLAKNFTIVIDGTGVVSYDKEPYPGCPYKVNKTGVKTYSHNVVEAKLVAENGFKRRLNLWVGNLSLCVERQDTIYSTRYSNTSRYRYNCC